MFHAAMGRFQLELFIFNTYFSTVVQLLAWAVKLQLSTAEARGQKKHPTRPVENIALTTKGLQEKKTRLVSGTTVEK